MAKIIRGKRKHQTVTIVDVEGEFAILATGHKIRLGMLEVDPADQAVIERNYSESDTFRIHYDLQHFMATGRFKKHHWASARA